MICEHCKTEYAPIAYNYGAVHTDQACRDVLKAQLASMTKRAEEAERENVDHVKVRTCAGCGGYLCPPLHCYACQKYKPDQMAIDLAKKCDAAEAKLATAREGFVSIKSYLNDNPGKNALGVVTNRWVSDVCNYALHALGIDPNKEKT